MTVSKRLRTAAAAVLWSAATVSFGQTPAALKAYVSEDAPVLVLLHVRVIDGTGAAAAEDQRIDIEGGKITRVQSAKLRNAYPPNAKVLDLSGKTVIPGLVGMHEHLFYPGPEGVKDGLPFSIEAIDSGPRLYLAGGVTTARTAGSMEPYTDLSLKKLIDKGEKPGPKLRITGPYLGDLFGILPQFHNLDGAEDAGRTVDYWAAEGVTSFKAFMGIKPEELKVAIEHAHAKGLKITGHLCAVGFREAAALGIDNLEHGIIVDTEFLPGKKPGVCPVGEAAEYFAKNLDIESAPVQDMIHDLVTHHVAVTSTLAVFEVSVPNRPAIAKMMRARDALSPSGLVDLSAGPQQHRRGKQSLKLGLAQEGDAIRARLRQGRRSTDGWMRSNLIRRSSAGVRRSAWARASRRGRIFARSRPFTLQPKTAQFTWARATRSARSQRARPPTWWSLRVTPRRTLRTSRTCNWYSRTARDSIQSS